MEYPGLAGEWLERRLTQVPRTGALHNPAVCPRGLSLASAVPRSAPEQPHPEDSRPGIGGGVGEWGDER